MTTKVTIDAHAGWPVEVKLLYGKPNTDKREATEVVAPISVRDFYIGSGLVITGVRELAKPVTIDAGSTVADSDGDDAS